MTQAKQVQEITDKFISTFNDLSDTNTSLDTMIKKAEDLVAGDKVHDAQQLEALRSLREARSNAKAALKSLWAARVPGMQALANRSTPTECPCTEPEEALSA